LNEGGNKKKKKKEWTELKSRFYNYHLSRLSKNKINLFYLKQ
jgi:hypothetical protein